MSTTADRKDEATRFRSFEKALTRITEKLCFILLLAIVFDVLLAVLSRYVFFYPLNFADQLAKYLLIWLVFMGAGLAVRSGAHIAVDLLTRRLSSGIRKIVIILIDLLISIFLVMVVVHGFSYAWSTRIFNDPLVFGISMIFPYLAIPVGCLSILVQFNFYTMEMIRSENSGSQVS